MNAELRELFTRVGWWQASTPDAWRYIVVLNNYGAIPRSRYVDEHYALKGFKVLLLNEQKRPQFFARCADINDGPMQRECDIMSALAAHPSLQNVVPKTVTATTQHLRCLSTEFVRGSRFDRIESSLSAAAWGAHVRRILDKAELLGRLAWDVLPSIASVDPEMTLRSEVQDDLERLKVNGVEEGIVKTIDRYLADIPAVPAVLQHGDLWSRNVLVERDRYWIIDFDEFANVRVPLYDVFHFIASSTRRFDRPELHDHLELQVRRQIIRERADGHGLSQRQLLGALLYYWTHLAAYRLRGGVPRQFREPHLITLFNVVERIRRGDALAEWLI